MQAKRSRLSAVVASIIAASIALPVHGQPPSPVPGEAAAQSAEIVGRVETLDFPVVGITFPGNLQPSVGDSFEVILTTPDGERGRVAAGKITFAKNGVLLGRCDEATGEIAVGLKVRIAARNPRPVVEASPQAAIRPAVSPPSDHAMPEPASTPPAEPSKRDGSFVGDEPQFPLALQIDSQGESVVARGLGRMPFSAEDSTPIMVELVAIGRAGEKLSLRGILTLQPDGERLKEPKSSIWVALYDSTSDHWQMLISPEHFVGASRPGAAAKKVDKPRAPPKSTGNADIDAIGRALFTATDVAARNGPTLIDMSRAVTRLQGDVKDGATQARANLVPLWNDAVTTLTNFGNRISRGLVGDPIKPQLPAQAALDSFVDKPLDELLAALWDQRIRTDNLSSVLVQAPNGARAWQIARVTRLPDGRIEIVNYGSAPDGRNGAQGGTGTSTTGGSSPNPNNYPPNLPGGGTITTGGAGSGGTSSGGTTSGGDRNLGMPPTGGDPRRPDTTTLVNTDGSNSVPGAPPNLPPPSGPGIPPTAPPNNTNPPPPPPLAGDGRAGTTRVPMRRPPHDVVVPSVTGMSLNEAGRVLLALELDTDIVPGKPTPDGTSNRYHEVYEQKPAAGTTVVSGTTVALTFYNYQGTPPEVTVLVGEDSDQAPNQAQIDAARAAANRSLGGQALTKGPDAPGSDLNHNGPGIAGASTNMPAGSEAFGTPPSTHVTPAGDVEVPTVVGLSFQQAAQALNTARLGVTAVAGRPAAAGAAELSVYEQDPKPGARVRAGASVSVTFHYSGPAVTNPIATGHAPPQARPAVRVPRVTGLTVAEARAAIEAADLQVRSVEGLTASRFEDSERVYHQEPGARIEVQEGDIVQIVHYGRYSPPKYLVTVPRVIGKSIGAARTVLEEAGLEVESTVKNQPSDAASASNVYSQTPRSGTDVRRGSTVRLEVYGEYTPPSPDDVVVRSLYSLSWTEARNALQAAGLDPHIKFGKAASNRADEFHVYDQEPTAGSRVAPGSPVYVTVYLRYREPPQAAAPVVPQPVRYTSLTGNWNCSCGAVWVLQQQGQNVVGQEAVDGRVRRFQGTFANGELRFHWQNTDGDRGQGVMVPNPNLTRMNWRMNLNSGETWDGSVERAP